MPLLATSGNFFLSEVNNSDNNSGAIEANNDMYCFQKYLPLLCEFVAKKSHIFLVALSGSDCEQTYFPSLTFVKAVVTALF